MVRKFIFYLKDCSRNLVITDESDSKEEDIIETVSKTMDSGKTSLFRTNKDIVILRSSDIRGVHIIAETNKKKIEDFDFSDLDKMETTTVVEDTPYHDIEEKKLSSQPKDMDDLDIDEDLVKDADVSLGDKNDVATV